MKLETEKIFVCIIVLVLSMSAHSREPDIRNIETGLAIPNENYCDQPYVVITKDGGWLCVMTTGPGQEGGRGQHVICTASEDSGRTWSRPVDIEPSAGPEASWAIPLITPSGRVYVFYTYNGEDVRTFPNGKVIRADTHGWFVYRYSDDNGKTWSERHRLPMRVTACDRSNHWQGKVQMFWSIDSPITFGNTAMFGFTKLGKYLLEEGEGWFYRSDNILTESDVTKIEWQLLPDGDHGLRAPEFGSVQEEHNITALSNNDLYCMYRTANTGHPIHAYSRDGGHTWSKPEPATYTPGGRRFKHNRACPKLWRTKNGKYLFWFNNHGALSYQTRNPVWLSGGIEKDGYIHWSQPEILLFDPSDKTIGMSYPDLIEQDGRYWITETQKTVARVHEIDQTLLEGLWRQGEVRTVSNRGLVFDYNSNQQSSSQLQMPELPDVAAGDGFTIDFWIFCKEVSAGQIILDARDADGKGLSLATTDKQSISLTIHADNATQSWDSDSGSIEAGKWHHVAVIVDGGPRVISWVIDGLLCDGGKERRQGWYKLSGDMVISGQNEKFLMGSVADGKELRITDGPSFILAPFAQNNTALLGLNQEKMIDIPNGRYEALAVKCTAGIPIQIAPSLKGTLKSLRIYDRYLRTSEVIGNYHAGKKASAMTDDIPIADFESGNYGQWDIVGEAFGKRPTSLKEQEKKYIKSVLGVQGDHFINSSFSEGDKSTGKLISPEFTVERKYLNLLVGGGAYAQKTCVNVIIGDSVVATLTGGKRDYLKREFIDLSQYIGQKARVEIVDNYTGSWGTILADEFVLSNTPECADKEYVFTIDKPYLILPVETGASKQRVKIDIGGAFFDEFDMELPQHEPAFYTFIDLRKHQGKEMRVVLPKLDTQYFESAENIQMADEVPGFDNLYNEALRPRFHYTAKRGWLSDANGLVYHDGVFHMYYQHNPYGWYCWNIHWGHATSTDLIHWQEQPVALYPKKYGDWAYSGSAVVDFKNASGFQKGQKPPIVVAYTSTARGECIAYSNDGGMSYTEYEGNPVLKPFPRVYDPGMIWYEPGQHWVMAGQLNEGGEHIGFHTSEDLKTWTYQSKVRGFHSCQHIYPLPHPSKKGVDKWIIHGMDGEYMIGDFDGKVFTPDTKNKIKYNYGSSFVAAQSFNNMPDLDKRHISLAFTYNGVMPDMPFNVCMLFPVENKLQETKNGLRVCPTPIKEIQLLHDTSVNFQNKSVTQINDYFKTNKDMITDAMHIKLKLKNVKDKLTMQINGANITLDRQRQSVICTGELKPPVEAFPRAGTPWRVHINKNGEVAAPIDFDREEIELEILVDRTTIEVFGNKGEVYMPIAFYFHYDLIAGVFGWPGEKYRPITFIDPNKREISLSSSGEEVQVTSFELHTMKSMWE